MVGSSAAALTPPPPGFTPSPYPIGTSVLRIPLFQPSSFYHEGHWEFSLPAEENKGAYLVKGAKWGEVFLSKNAISYPPDPLPATSKSRRGSASRGASQARQKALTTPGSFLDLYLELFLN